VSDLGVLAFSVVDNANVAAFFRLFGE